MSELLPCPFCGELPFTEYTPGDGRLCDAAEIKCRNRLCPVQPKTDALTYNGSDEQRAARYWNTRTLQAPEPHQPQTAGEDN